MDGLGAAQAVGVDFGEPDRADLAFLDQLGHRLDGFLDRAAWVLAMQIVEIDMVGLQQP